MKKKIFISFVCIILLTSFLVILNNNEEKDIKIIYVDDINEKKTTSICAINENGLLEVINIEYEIENKNTQDKYLSIFKVFNEYRNYLPINYSSPIKNLVSLKTLNVKDNTMIIEIESLYNNENINILLDSLLWTYKDFNIKEISLIFNNKNYYVNVNSGINVKVFGNLDSHKHLIYHFTELGYIPITYYHNQDKIIFTIKEFIDYYDYDFEYDIKYVNDEIEINVQNKKEINVEHLKELKFNLENINENKKIVINCKN